MIDSLSQTAPRAFAASPAPGEPSARVRLPLVAALAGFGERTAVETETESLSYAGLARHAAEGAAALGDRRRLVMIEGGNHIATLTTYLGALQGGHVAWLVPPGARSAALRERFRPDVIARCDREGVRLEELSDATHELNPDLALLLGTSGSTGAPRLVRLSHGSLQANADAIVRYLGIEEDEAAVTSLPMHYCYGLSVVNSHLLCGARLVLTDRSVADPGFWTAFRERGGTSIAGVPHTFALLDRAGFASMHLPSLRYLTQAGGRMDPATVRRYAGLGARRGWRLVVMYGQTEATARMAYLPSELAAARPESIGRPIPGGELSVEPVPEEGRPGVGELVYRGPNVMLGYAHDPADLGLGRTVHELRTGDLARRAPDGLYEVVGRRARFAKPYGLRIDLDEVERICDREGVRAAVTGDDARLAVLLEGEVPRDFGTALAARLGLPAHVVSVGGAPWIPRLPNGKTDYAGVVEAVPLPLAGAGPADVAAAFRDVLGRDAVGDDDTFAGLGGDSLSYVEMSLALEELVGRLPDDWPERTVRELSALAPRTAAKARVEMNVALRGAAIALVVASHMTAFWPAGGAHLLLALSGHSFARFQLAATGPRRLTRRATSILRVAIPSSAWIGLWWALTGMYGLGAMLLVNNYTGAQDLSGGRWQYWFVEALVQILIVLALVFAIPAVRRAERAHHLAFAFGALALALVFRFEIVAVGAHDNLAFRPHAVAWIFALGWAAQRATTVSSRAAVAAVVLASVPGFFGDPVREAVVGGGMLLLLWVPVIVVPRPVGRVIGAIAAASLAIYLTHWQVYPLLGEMLPIAIAIPATIGAGVLAGAALERLIILGGRMAARRASSPPEQPYALASAARA